METAKQQLFESNCVESWTQAAGKRGGDFIIRHATPGMVTVVLADATGHGDKAAELTAYLQPIIAREIGCGLSPELLRRWHKLVYRRFSEQHRFVCITVLQLNLVTQSLTIANGGNPDLLIRRGLGRRVERYPSTGMPLGIVDESEWTPPEFQTTYLSSIDYAFCCSDGVTDCISPDGERFGLGRVCNAVQVAGTTSPLQAVRWGLLRFLSPLEDQDDLSILVLRGLQRQVA
ncbi:MAG TPA: PP2C family protein-serine/threonine phosphatase [Phycisphaerae bacterium]|nr:PP2C family protein-serine/threonine phosphatase [Phycisphaerae bacterium]